MPATPLLLKEYKAQRANMDLSIHPIPPIAHFQKEWWTGARMGACSVMGLFGDTIARGPVRFSFAPARAIYVSEKVLTRAILPPNDPIIFTCAHPHPSLPPFLKVGY